MIRSIPFMTSVSASAIAAMSSAVDGWLCSRKKSSRVGG
jgi:hypothetical protein